MKNIEDNKKFWKTVKSFFSDKSNNFENAETFKKYLKNLVPNLDLQVPNNLLCQTPKNGDEVLAAISKYQNHSIIQVPKQSSNPPILVFLSK